MQKTESKRQFRDTGFYKVVNKIVHMKYFSLICWILLVIIFWEIIAMLCEQKFNHGYYYIPHLSQIFSAIGDKNIKIAGKSSMVMIFKATGSTLSRALIGFIIGTILGFALAFVMDLCKVVEKLAFPYLMLLQMVPIIGMAPVIFAITGDVSKARIVIAAILTFYPVTTNVMAGFKSVEKEKHDLMDITSAKWYQKYWYTKFPACLPSFFTGLKIAAPLAITASVLVDTLQGGNTLGGLISQSLKGVPSYYIFWEIVIICAVVGVGSSALMGLLDFIFCPYRHGRKSLSTLISIQIRKKKAKKGSDENVESIKE